jgi:hypothetical protein
MKCPSCNVDSWAHAVPYIGDLCCTMCGLTGHRDVLEGLAARLAENVPRYHHDNVAQSRREWIDAATSVLGPDWNGTPDDLRVALAARLAPADPAKVELLRAFVLASRRAAWKLATAYVRREVSPRAEYESLFRAAGLRVGFDSIDTDGELKVIELLRDLKLTMGDGHG